MAIARKLLAASAALGMASACALLAYQTLKLQSASETLDHIEQKIGLAADHPSMSFVEFTKNGVTTIVPLMSEEGVDDWRAAIRALDSGNNKEETWTIGSGATIHLVVPPKDGEDPLGPAHCQRFVTLRDDLQMTPGLEPVD